MKLRPGKMMKQVMASIFKEPATIKYVYKEAKMPKGFRGQIKFDPSKCVGCKLCMKDCPSAAIVIRKIGDKKFEAEFDLGKCIFCGQCVESCFKKALEITDGFELAQLDKAKLKVVFNVEAKEELTEKTE